MLQSGPFVVQLAHHSAFNEQILLGASTDIFMPLAVVTQTTPQAPLHPPDPLFCHQSQMAAASPASTGPTASATPQISARTQWRQGPCPLAVMTMRAQLALPSAVSIGSSRTRSPTLPPPARPASRTRSCRAATRLTLTLQPTRTGTPPPPRRVTTPMTASTFYSYGAAPLLVCQPSLPAPRLSTLETPERSSPCRSPLPGSHGPSPNPWTP